METTRYRVLLVEHEPSRNVRGVIDAMEANGATVESVQSLEEMERVIGRRWYDIIVTDAYFLAPDEEHFDESGASVDGDYLLDVIIGHTEHALNQNLVLVVYTWWAPTLFADHGDDLARVHDVWEKKTPVQILGWKMQRLLEIARIRSPGQKLIQILRGQLDRTETDLPWKTPMLEMLDLYQRYRGEREQVEQVSEKTKAIAGEFGLSAPVGQLLEALIGMEPFNVASKRRAWGHLRHVINVFWLGYYILNCTPVNRAKMSDIVLGDRPGREPDTDFVEVNIAWLLAALFHDVGLMGERFSSIYSESAGLCRKYGIGRPVVKGTSEPGAYEGDGEVYFDCLKELQNALKELAEVAPRGEGSWLSELSGSLRSVDHGVLSAAALLKNFERYGTHNVIQTAATAAAIHNFGSLAAVGEASPGTLSPPSILAASSPISALLVLCDQLQVWDRWTGQESQFEGLALEAAELGNIGYSDDEGLVLEIVYRPYRSALPIDHEVTGVEQQIRKLLTRKVYEILDQVDWSGNIFPTVTLKPRVGTREITPWTSRKSA